VTGDRRRENSLGNNFTCKNEVNIKKNTACYLSGMEGEVFSSGFNIIDGIRNTNLGKNKEIYYNGEVGGRLSKEFKDSNAGGNVGMKMERGGGVKNNLHCLYMNIRLFINTNDKREELRIILQQQEVYILVLTESLGNETILLLMRR